MKLFLSWMIFFFSSWALAQKPYAYQAEVINEEVSIYKKPDLNSEIIATAEGGLVFDVSQKTTQGFYKVRLKPGLLGYVQASDVKPLFGNAPTPKVPAKKKTEKKKETSYKKRPFEFTQYTGLQYALVQFQEDSMGGDRTENLGFFGVKLSGPDLMVEGAFPTEVNFLFHTGAPSYYEKLTGNSADGWVFITNFLWQQYFPQGRNALTFFGFGPSMRYSKFNVSLTDRNTSKTTAYSLEDITFGAVFNLGASVRMGNWALRADVHYYWEARKYLGTALALQFGF